MPDESRNTVSITDIDMPFLSMVRFMVKWAIASIPALIILMILAAVFWGALIAIVTSVGSALSRAKPSAASATAPATSGTGAPSSERATSDPSAADDATAKQLHR